MDFLDEKVNEDEFIIISKYSSTELRDDISEETKSEDINLKLPYFVKIKEVDVLKCIEYELDKRLKINSETKNDKLYLQNVFNRNMITSEIYPIIYNSLESDNINYGRSIEFYKMFSEDALLQNTLEEEQLIRMKIGIRDLMECISFDLSEIDLSIEIVKKCLNNINTNQRELIQIGKYLVSPYPTADNFLKFHIKIDDIDLDRLGTYKEYFLKVKNYIIGFVAPEDLSYSNFENIINVNEYFETFEIRRKNVEIETFYNDCYKIKMKSNLREHLLKMDEFGLYTVPINKNNRGGLRFIFNSEDLGIKLYNTLIRILPEEMTNGLVKVNNVFRYNKFLPSDYKFESHMDTPYIDSLNKHYSKYTMIIYLTSGNNPIESVIKFKEASTDDKETEYLEEGKIKSIELGKDELMCVIFDQKYEHEGYPYLDGTKIFIRTELI